jgi:hypothetical protein
VSLAETIVAAQLTPAGTCNGCKGARCPGHPWRSPMHVFQVRLVGHAGPIHVKANDPTQALELARRYSGILDAPVDVAAPHCFRVDACGRWDDLQDRELPIGQSLPWPGFPGESQWERGASGY